MIPDECMEKLEQLILDENELVTYKMLSKELKMHVNEAKKYLNNFLSIQNSKEEVKLYAYYFISGIVVKDNVEIRKMVVASEDNLEKIKKEFKEVTSCHIYSLNKGGCRDASSINNSQSWCKKWAEEHKEFSAIKHPNILQQAPIIRKAEMKKNEIKPVASKPSLVKTKSEVGSLFQTKPKNTLSTINEKPVEATKIPENATPKKDNSANSNSDSTDQKKSTLSSLWQKLEDKSKDGKSNTSKGDSKGKNKSAAKVVSKNNIMSMFSKQAERNAVNPVKKATAESVSTTKQESVTTVKVANDVQGKGKNHIEPEKNNNHKKTKAKTSTKKVKRSKQQSEEESDEDVKPKKKKHRRICTMDDSDSESENEEEQDRAQRSLTIEENNVSSTPISDDSEEPIPPTPPVIINKGKKKVWKTVQKTYQDEEGFLVAKQEKVLVSASDSDEDPLPKKNNDSITNSKQNTFLYRKQASLTSFFKQK